MWFGFDLSPTNLPIFLCLPFPSPGSGVIVVGGPEKEKQPRHGHNKSAGTKKSLLSGEPKTCQRKKK
jgi:hypothetical protein